MNSRTIRSFLFFSMFFFFERITALVTPSSLFAAISPYCPENTKYSSCFYLAQNAFSKCEVWDFYCQCEQLNIISNICSRYCLNLSDDNNETRDQIKVFCSYDIIKPYMPVFSPGPDTETSAQPILQDKINMEESIKSKVFKLIPFSNESKDIVAISDDIGIIQDVEKSVVHNDNMYITDVKPNLFKLVAADERVSQLMANHSSLDDQVSAETTIINSTKITDFNNSDFNCSALGVSKNSTIPVLSTNNTVLILNMTFSSTTGLFKNFTNTNGVNNNATGYLGGLNSTTVTYLSDASKSLMGETKLLLLSIILGWLYVTV